MFSYGTYCMPLWELESSQFLEIPHKKAHVLHPASTPASYATASTEYYFSRKQERNVLTPILHSHVLCRHLCRFRTLPPQATLGQPLMHIAIHLTGNTPTGDIHDRFPRHFLLYHLGVVANDRFAHSHEEVLYGSSPSPLQIAVGNIPTPTLGGAQGSRMGAYVRTYVPTYLRTMLQIIITQ